MAKILIRNYDRRILFFTYDDSMSDLDPLIFQHYGHAPNDHEVINTHRPPANLRLGAYLTATLTSADIAPDPSTVYGRGLERLKDFNTWLDAEIAKLSGVAILSVPEVTRQRWTLYLRMLAMVTLHRVPFEDNDQWALVGAAQASSPFDFATLTTAEASTYAGVQGEGGLYFEAWWDAATKAAPKSSVFTDPLRNPTGPNYDQRAASLVTLIPEGEIDRSDRTISGRDQPWGSRERTTKWINSRMPWYSR